MSTSLFPTLVDCLNALPPLLSTDDLINLGIVSSHCAARTQRHRRKGPPFILLSEKKVVYPRDSLIKYLIDRGLIFPEDRKLEAGYE